MLLGQSAHAQPITKADNFNNLNQAASWVGGIAPGAGDFAIWDDTVTGPSAVLLGANLNWLGLRILNPGGPVTFDAGSTLALGTGGIDMSQATQDLTINATTRIGSGEQTWNVAANRTLTISTVPLRNTPGSSGGNNVNVGGTLTISTTGTVKIGTTAVPLILDGGGNPFVTYGKSDWAATDESGKVIAATYTNSADGVLAGAIVNVDSSFTVGSLDISALRFADTTAARTITISGNNTFTARGILVAPGSLGGTITGGNLRPYRVSTAGASFSFIQNSLDGDLTIASSLPMASVNTPVSIVKSGVGKLILTANNGNGGHTFINAGTLQLGNGGPSGGVGGTNPILNNGTLVINRSDVVSLTNTISGTGNVIHAGPGELALSPTNTYTGATSITGGTLNLAALQELGNGTVLNFGGGTLKYVPGFAGDLSTRTVNLNAGGGTIHTNGNNVLLANPIGNGGAGNLTKTGEGTLTLAAANNYTGSTLISEGTLRLANSTGSATGTGSLVVNSGGILSGTGSASGVVTINAGGVLSPGNGVGTLTLGGLTLTPSAILDFEFNAAGADQVIISGANGLTINGGGFHLFAEGTQTQWSTPGTYNLFSFMGAIQGAGLGQLSVLNPVPGYNYTFGTSTNLLTLTIAPAGLITAWNADANGTWGTNANWSNTSPNQASATASFGGVITAPRSITVDGAKTVGSISIDSAQSYTFTAGAGGTLTFNNGTKEAQLAVLKGSHTISTPIALGSNLKADVLSDAAVTLTSPVSGAASITKTGTGTLALSGANTYSAGTSINEGTVQFARLNSLGSGDIAFGGGALRWAAGNTDDISDRNVTIHTGGATLDTNGNDVTLFMPIGNDGEGGLTKTGNGTLTLFSLNTYKGETVVRGGTLSISSNGNLGDGPTGARLRLSGGTLAVTESMNLDDFGTSPRNVAIGSAGGTINVAEFATLLVNGTVTGSGPLTKSGEGILRLGGNNSLTLSSPVTLAGGTVELVGGQPNGQQGIGTGPITFQGGTLIMNGSFGDNSGGFGTLANPLIIPEGQTGTLYMTTRGTLSSSLTGEGTFNLNVNFVRGEVLPNWTNFTGQINVNANGAGPDDFRISGYVALNIPNARLHLGDSVWMYQNFNPPNAGTFETVHTIGELSGSAGAVIGGNPVGGRFVNWHVGALGTDSIFEGVIQDSAGVARFTKDGTGTLTLSGASTYTGSTTINDGTLLVSGSIGGTTAVTVNYGATLRLGANDAVNDLAALTLNGGTFATGGFSDTLGTLSLGGDVTLDLGAGASILHFANSAENSWFGSLTVLNWSGSSGGGGLDRLIFGSDATGLSAEQLELVQFLNPAGFTPGSYRASMLPSGEIVVIPEPASFALLSMGALGLLLRRRRA